MNSLTIQQSVRDYLLESFFPGSDGAELHDDDDLLLSLNSLQLLRMVIELESRYGIAIDNRDLTPENLGTIERIRDYLDRRLR
ncbi:MAG: phosphopantetheine-binding protein [Planctomycetales bacterium]